MRPSKRCPEHLAWIRSLPCVVIGCRNPAEAAHVRWRTDGGTGTKPSDRWSVPLCHDHHMQQHAIGHRAFDEKHGIDSRALAECFAARSPYLKV